VVRPGFCLYLIGWWNFNLLESAGEELAHNAEALRASLSEENGGSDLEVLGAVHESELDEAGVARPHQVLVHVDHLCALPDHAAVDHRLVVGLDRGGVVQDLDLSFEVVDALRVGGLVEHDHAFAEASPLELVLLEHGLDCKADSLACRCRFNENSFVVDSLDLDRLELSEFVGPQIQDLIWHDRSRLDSTSHNDSHTSHLVDAVNVELARIVDLSKQARDGNS